jgi:hypothetical protein
MLSTVHGALGRSQPLKVRTRCVRVAGILSGIAGQLADDTARPDRSAAWFDAAEIAAEEVGDEDLSAWILALRSIGCYFRGEYVLADTLLDRARAAGAASTARRQAWLAVLSARSRAAVAGRGGAAALSSVMRAIDDGRDFLSEAGAPSDTDFFDGPRLAGMAGTAMLRLGATRQARPLLDEALYGRSAADVKGRALLTLDLAECVTIDGEPGEAARLAAQAISVSAGSAIRPVAARAREIHAALRPWAATSAVLDLGAQLAEAQAAGTED